MGEFRESHTVFGPFPDADPLDTARLFLRTNGYSVVEEKTEAPPPELQVEPPGNDDETGSEDGEDTDESPDVADADSDESAEAEPAADEEPQDILTELRVERGKSGRGWFSSNLTELKTEVRLRLEGNKVKVDYKVDTTGQHLWDEEREFWKKEAKALESFMLDEAGLSNLAETERARASEVRRDFVMMGFWIGAIVAIVLFLVLVTLYRAV